jgi:hypothetical protein
MKVFCLLVAPQRGGGDVLVNCDTACPLANQRRRRGNTYSQSIQNASGSLHYTTDPRGFGLALQSSSPRSPPISGRARPGSRLAPAVLHWRRVSCSAAGASCCYRRRTPPLLCWEHNASYRRHSNSKQHRRRRPAGLLFLVLSRADPLLLHTTSLHASTIYYAMP